MSAAIRRHLHKIAGRTTRRTLLRIACIAATGACGAGSEVASSALVIDEDGIGPARRGLSVGDLRRALPPDVTLGELDPYFMVDISAVPVIAGTDTLYHLLFPASDVVNEARTLEFVATLHEGARTADGIGPGLTLAEAVELRGSVTLSYSVHDESREYARFESQPSNMFFRVRPASEEEVFAGIYSTEDEYNTTSYYDPEARIWMVMVDLSRP